MTASFAAQILAANPQISAQVSANAGTGKTHVLTQRVLRLLLAQVKPSRIVCLTYTRTAAAEMSERISSTLQKWAIISDAELVAELEKLTNSAPSDEDLRLARELFAGVLNAMPPPRIQTIHSFCQEILKRFPLEAGLTPYFSVIDDVTAKELLAEAKQRIIHNQERHELVAAIEYIAAYINETWFNEMLAEVISSRNKFRKFLVQGERFEKFIDADVIYQSLADYNADLLRILVREWTENSTSTHDKLLAQWNVFLSSQDIDDFLPLFLTQEKEPKKSVANSAVMKANPELGELIAREQTRIAGVLDAWRNASTHNLSYAVQVVAEAFIEVYDNLKRAKNVLDYEDLIFYTNQLFAQSDSAAWILYKLDGGIDHILIDEAQDASPEQWDILQYITAEFFSGEGGEHDNRTMFIVGDEKQSIYSFQGAQPQKLRQVAGEYGAACVEAQKEWHTIPLSMSFRSLPAVLEFIDNVFNIDTVRQAASGAQELISHAAFRAAEGRGLVELWPLFEKPEYPEQKNWTLPIESYKSISNEVDLAEKIAKTIKKWLSEGRVLKSTGKPVEAGDIIILLRSRGKLADILVRKLKENFIPVAGADRLKLTEHIAIQDLLALAEFCLFPLDDLSLAAALKSPIFGVSEELLFEIAYARGEKNIAEIITNKYPDLAQKLAALHERFSQSSPYEFYNHLLNNMNMRQAFLQRLGEEVNDPLDEFLDLLLEFERGHSRSMQNFLQWFKTSEYEIKRDMEARASEVRVMTIHAAKGLQAPIVFLPDTSSAVTRARKPKIYWGEGKFFALQNMAAASEFLQALIEDDKRADAEEYLRLLYVALTRAADEIYIAGMKGSKKIPEGCWYEILARQIAETWCAKW